MIYCHKCKSEHEGWDIATCRQRKTANTNVPALLKQTILGDPSGPVLVKKAKNKPVTRDEPKAAHVTATKPKPVTRDKSASRMTELRKRKAATGLIEVRGLWAHVDDHAAIKEYAKDLASKR